LAAVLLLMGGPALACRAHAPLNLGDVRFADAVVVGRISNYRIIRDEDARRRHEVARSRDLSLGSPERSEEQGGFLSDYARFDVAVDETLAGGARKTLSVTWDNSTYGEPEAMPPGPYLIALRHPGSRLPPLRGPSVTILPNRQEGLLTVLQAPCARAFVFQAASAEAADVRRILRQKPDRSPAR